MQKQRLHRFLGRLGLLAGAGVLLLLIYHLFGFGIPCLFHSITGLYCPGCGTMRAMVSLLQLQWLQALRYNTLFVLALPLLLGFGMGESMRYLGGGKPTKTTVFSWIVIALFAIVTVGFTILRNLPAFAFLAPTPLA